LIDRGQDHVTRQVPIFKYAKTKKAFYGELPTEDIAMAENVTKEAHAMDFKMAVGLLGGLEHVSLSAYAIVLLALTTSMNIARFTAEESQPAKRSDHAR
jgi:hypothetical protein